LLIDTDVSTKRRGEFIDIITKKHGRENVSQIGTFGTLASKAICDTIGKVMNIDKDIISTLKKKIGENKVSYIISVD
jgi:DNA polymerase-3 subunit alpha